MSTPNTTLYLLSNVPLDNTYTDTIYFENINAQQTFFNTKISRTFTNLTYQRIGDNRIRVQASADSLYNCNYLMFQNTGFGNKWFYAFITETPKYINDNTTEIVYEIDVMQTYFFDAVLKPSYIIRQHQSTDIAGDNTLPEPVDIGDIKAYYEDSVIFNSYDVVVAHVHGGVS